MTTDLKSLLNPQLRNVDSAKVVKRRLSIDAVDKLADEIVFEYNNSGFRKWYCGVINDFGFSKVNEWRIRSREGKEPSRLFSKFVKDARAYNGARRAGA